MTKRDILRDRDVRKALHSQVLREHWEQPDTLVLNELGLRHGTCRVDVAVVNGHLHGFEIKSDADTLDRLPDQVDVYSRVLDKATLVVGQRHASKAMASIPTWWGVKVFSLGDRGGVSFATERTTSLNPQIEPLAVAELLWRPEVSKILLGLGVSAQVLFFAKTAITRVSSPLRPPKKPNPL